MSRGIMARLLKNKHHFIKKQELDESEIRQQWHNFLSKNTYLIYDEKRYFIIKISQLSNFPWHYWLDLRLYRKNKRNLENLLLFRRSVESYNDGFVESRLHEYKSFFDGSDDGLKHSLDEDQRISVIRDDKHNLVVAGAGSGKTSVITNRIAYLIRRKDKIPKGKILALAFTRVAAQEMEKRLLSDYDIKINISTFHKLGKDIIYENTSEKPTLIFDRSDPSKEKDLFNKLFFRVIKQKGFRSIFLKYLAFCMDQEVEEASFSDKAEYHRYMKNRKYTTLNNKKVKSISERDIANFFFINEIDFVYESTADWAEVAEGKKYDPDFYLPAYDIYIEHWGLNEKRQVPKWFSKTSEEYREERKWKLNQFKKHNKILVETWEYERTNNLLISNLKKNLIKLDDRITFSPMSYRDLVEKTFEFKEKTGEITDLIISFVKIAKSNYLETNEISRKLKSKKFTQKQRLFGQLALEVYRIYQSFLESENKIDFNDMINKAVLLLQQNQGRYKNKYDHILIDEFQDISYQRLELINCFVNNKSNTKLFCVGDDWQSIYQFTGSEVNFFVNFYKFFPNPECTSLKRNYRSTQRIVAMSNKLISFNDSQISKEVYSRRELGKKVFFYEISDKLRYDDKRQAAHVYSLLKELLDSGVKPDDIMILARFNRNLLNLKQYCGSKRIPINEKYEGIRFYSVHKSKGSEASYVFLIDIVSGMYGFPCEVNDSSVLELAKRNVNSNHFEEERRLFYVALTRSKKFLYIYTKEKEHSIFIKEINQYLQKKEEIGYIEFY